MVLAPLPMSSEEEDDGDDFFENGEDLSELPGFQRGLSLPGFQRGLSRLASFSLSQQNGHHSRVLDHYSLPTPSSKVIFRSTNVHVYDSQGSQLILEERLTARKASQIQGSKTASSSLLQGTPYGTMTTNVTLKRVVYSSPEMLFLRGLYSAIAFFQGSFLFIFAVGLLLFVISDLANEGRDIIVYGNEGKGDFVFPFIGTILSIPVFIHGLTQIMTLSTSFVSDTFSGSPLLHSFGGGVVLTNWIKFIFFIGIPSTTFISLLFSGSPNVIERTLVMCFVSVSFLFFCFSVVVVFLRMSACFYLVQELHNRDDMTMFERLKYTLLTAEETALSGEVHNNYIYCSDIYNLKKFDSFSTDHGGDNEKPYQYSSHGHWRIKLTQLMPKGLFITLDEPRRRWTQAEIDFNVPFYTKKSWSLESVFCRQKNSNHISMVSGQSAMTFHHTRSSLTCYLYGVFFYILSVAGFMVYFDAPPTLMAIVICLVIAYWAWQGRKELRLIRHINEILRKYQDEEDADTHDRALFQQWERYTVTKPTPTFAWICFGIKNFVIAMVPFAYFCYSRNLIGSLLYLFLFGLSFQESYFDIGPIVEGMGSFGTLGLESGATLSHDGLLGALTRKEWQKKSRLYHITRMNNASRGVWQKLLGFLTIIFATIAIAAISAGSGQEEGVVPNTTFPTNNSFFYDEPQEEVSPMCTANFGKNQGANTDGMSSSNSPVKYLADYNFLANIPYFRTDSIQSVLDAWFGEGEAVLDQDIIPAFREAHPELPSAASFQLVTFSDGSAVVCVRGTLTYFDFLIDVRLWYASSLFQLVQIVMPFGFAFDELIQFCVNRLSDLESESLKKVSYYVETTAFVNFLRESGKYTEVEITGHSLGGGLALITGAQTKTKAVGISAPSAVMGRQAVTPNVSLEDIKRYSHNVIPSRDLIPHLGGKHVNYSKISCRTGVNDPFPCHMPYTSLCELLYTCGGNVKRPVYCECVKWLGYPEPTASDGSGASLSLTCQNLEGEGR